MPTAVAGAAVEEGSARHDAGSAAASAVHQPDLKPRDTQQQQQQQQGGCPIMANLARTATAAAAAAATAASCPVTSSAASEAAMQPAASTLKRIRSTVSTADSGAAGGAAPGNLISNKVAAAAATGDADGAGVDPGAAAAAAAASQHHDPVAAAAEAAAPLPRSASGTAQAWARPARPLVDAAGARLTRRHLRRLERGWTRAEVARHRSAGDAWIAVKGRVYDITEHVATHPGWDGAGVTTVLSILAHAGTECTAEFEEIHRPWPVAWRQLAAFDIGPLLD